MKVLQCECDLRNVKQRNIIWEYIFFPKKPENLTTLNKIEYEIEIDLVLESLNKIYNKRMRGPSQYILFIFNMIYLF